MVSKIYMYFTEKYFLSFIKVTFLQHNEICSFVFIIQVNKLLF